MTHLLGSLDGPPPEKTAKRANKASGHRKPAPNREPGAVPEVAPLWTASDEGADVTLGTMSSDQVHGCPVIDGHDPIGMVALAEAARALSIRPVGDLMDATSKPSSDGVTHRPTRRPAA